MFAHFHDQLTPFVGRTQSLADVTSRLANPECRLLTLVGSGGSGKTRLAIEAARMVKDRFPDGAVFVGLQPLSKSDLLVTTIARAVGLTYGSNDPQMQLFNTLREKSLLLVLDNFEHLLDGAAFLSTLLAYSPGIKLLVTSREVLNLQEEWLYPLKGMDTPLSIYSSSPEDYDAIQLFLYHARRMQPNFELASAREAVIQICSVAEGLPLAIELAASWLKGLSAAQIASEMRRNLDFLATNTRNVEERHRSMRAVFDQSWKFLTEDERLIFAKLSVFPGGFDSDSAEQVADASISCLSTLVEKSLVQMESSERYGIHEMLRQYGMEKLQEYSATEATYDQFSRVFAQRMLHYDSELKQVRQLESIQAIERDLENIRLAWEWSAQHRQADNVRAMMNGLYLFGFLRSRYREITAMFQFAIDQNMTDPTLSPRLYARRWGYLHWLSEGDYQEPIAHLEQALRVAYAENDSFEIGFGHLVSAFAMIGLHSYTDALPHLETSRTTFEAANDPYYVCWVLHRLGYCYYNLNDSVQANQYTEQSLVLARVTHNRASLVACLLNLGSHHLLNSNYLKGQSHCEEALQVASESGHQGQTAHALSLLALCAFFQGKYAACRDYAEHSTVINAAIRPGVFQPYNQSLLILLACLDEDYDEGLRISESGDHRTIDKMGFQLLYWSLIALSAGLGKPADVRLYLQKLLDVSAPEVNSVTTVWIVPGVASMLAATHPEKAVELLAWVFSYDDLALNWARQWPLFERLQTRLQAALGVDAYEKHWEKGQSLSLDRIKIALNAENFASGEPSVVFADDAPPILTARELEILRLLASGLTNPQIAAELVIGAGTVKTHTLSIYRKLDVANRSQAIIRAQALGLLA